jgi:hypothetical protein
MDTYELVVKRLNGGKKEFSCDGCDSLKIKYISDGFDASKGIIIHFYEWRCQSKKLRLIGPDEPFHSCKVPSWCPKVVNLKKRSDKAKASCHSKMDRYALLKKAPNGKI